MLARLVTFLGSRGWKMPSSLPVAATETSITATSVVGLPFSARREASISEEDSAGT
jgi:hypothetical protein